MNENEKLSASVMEAVHAGKTIQAIKLLREEKGLGLKEAKDIIDQEINAYKIVNPNAVLRQKSSPWLTMFMVVLIVSAFCWYLMKGG